MGKLCHFTLARTCDTLNGFASLGAYRPWLSPFPAPRLQFRPWNTAVVFGRPSFEPQASPCPFASGGRSARLSFMGTRLFCLKRALLQLSAVKSSCRLKLTFELTSADYWVPGLLQLARGESKTLRFSFGISGLRGRRLSKRCWIASRVRCLKFAQTSVQLSWPSPCAGLLPPRST